MIGFLVAGLVIGALARLAMPGRQRLNIWLTLLIGVIGSLVGGTIANLIGSGSIWELNVFGFIVSVVAAVALIAAAERLGIGAGPGRGSIGSGRR